MVIDPAGKYLEQAVKDAKHVVEADVLPWFDRFNYLEEVLRTLVEDDEDQRVRMGVWPQRFTIEILPDGICSPRISTMATRY